MKKFKFVILGVLFFQNFTVHASEKLLVLMEIASITTSEYVVSSENQEYKAISDFALTEYKAKKPKDCKFSIQSEFRHGSEEDLFNSVKELAKSDKKTVIVGLSRSNFVRVAAKAALNTSLVGVSIGASTAQIKTINPNFVSVASPWTLQWEKLKTKMISDGCSKDKIVGIFDLTNPVSKNFRDSFKTDIQGKELFFTTSKNIASFKGNFDNAHCVFITLNLSQSETLLTAVDASPSVKHVYGPGEWNTFDYELNTLLGRIKRKDLEIHFPTGWIPYSKFASSRLAKYIQKNVGRLPSPQGVYFYDAMWISLEHLCGKVDVREFDLTKLKDLPLKRNYTGIAPGGNYLSPMRLLNFTKDKGKYEDNI